VQFGAIFSDCAFGRCPGLEIVWPTPSALIHAERERELNQSVTSLWDEELDEVLMEKPKLNCMFAGGVVAPFAEVLINGLA
jgi:hypothetical protein